MKLIKHKSRNRPRGERRLKAVAMLPSLATLCNLLCGFGAIYMCILSAQWHGDDLARPTLDSARIEAWFPTYVAIGAYLILLAMVFDVLDGGLARLTRKTSDFGGQLDSLCDIVSFGVAPAFLVISVARGAAIDPTELGTVAKIWWRAEWVMVAVYACCAAVRLARFNVENEQDASAHKYFRGLPSPGAAAAVIAMVILHEEFIRGETDLGSRWIGALAPPLTLMFGLLMVSPYRYPHLINTVLGKKGSSLRLIAAVGMIGGTVVHPQLAVAVAACTYALSGPVLAAWSRLFGWTATPAPPDAHQPDQTNSSDAPAPTRNVGG
jgi:CDP-diacylglycerol--serine O-phosphatidyltransferase